MLDLLAVPTIWVTIVITVVLVGLGALATGYALANSWKPIWQVWIYCVLLAGVDRFFIWGLGDGNALSPSGFVIDLVYLLIVGSLTFWATRAGKMVSQYPWMYERAGPIAWRRKSGSD
jgi:hypothetical protein